MGFLFRSYVWICIEVLCVLCMGCIEKEVKIELVLKLGGLKNLECEFLSSIFVLLYFN